MIIITIGRRIAKIKKGESGLIGWKWTAGEVRTGARRGGRELSSASAEAIGSKHLGKPTGFGEIMSERAVIRHCNWR